MKFVSFVFLCTLAFALQARADDVIGRASLTFWMQDSPDILSIDVRQEGSRILGQTFWGTSGSVDLTVKNEKYDGVAGGDGFTNLNCTTSQCKGRMAGVYGALQIQEGQSAGGHHWQSFKGRVNLSAVDALRTDQEIRVNSVGNMELKKLSDGVYEGYGYLDHRTTTCFKVRLETSGSLLNLDHKGLFAIFMIAPLSSSGY